MHFLQVQKKNKKSSEPNKKEQYCEFSALNICQSGSEGIAGAHFERSCKAELQTGLDF